MSIVIISELEYNGNQIIFFLELWREEEIYEKMVKIIIY